MYKPYFVEQTWSKYEEKKRRSSCKTREREKCRGKIEMTIKLDKNDAHIRWSWTFVCLDNIHFSSLQYVDGVGMLLLAFSFLLAVRNNWHNYSINGMDKLNETRSTSTDICMYNLYLYILSFCRKMSYIMKLRLCAAFHRIIIMLIILYFMRYTME